VDTQVIFCLIIGFVAGAAVGSLALFLFTSHQPGAELIASGIGLVFGLVVGIAGMVALILSAG
jgi:hypothetical protein